KGIWKDFGVKLIGGDSDAINITGDREKFKQLMGRIGVPVAPAKTVTSYLQGKEVAQEFGFPLVIRAYFILGGRAVTSVHKAEDFDPMATMPLEAFPIHAVLIDHDLVGWQA